ncbi:MAG: TraB/GumN family protein [Pseudomonadota bacterium]
MRFSVVSLILGFAVFSMAGATAPAVAQTDEIVVVGERSGPRLWRVRNDGAELYVLATVDFVPEDFDWNDKVVGYLLEDADRLLLPPTGELSGANTPRVLGAFLRTMIFNRGRIFMKRGETLEDKIDPTLANEFAVARARVDARNASAKKRRKARDAEQGADAPLNEPEKGLLEKELADFEPGRAHPFIQAQTLMSDAYGSANLEPFSEAITKRITKLAKKSGAKPRRVFEVEFAFRDLKLFLKSMRDFSQATNEVCIEEAIVFAETELPTAYERARAWARGDVDYLQQTIEPKPASACELAVSNELGGLKSFDGARIDEVDFTQRWIDAIKPSLSTPGVRVALVPFDGWMREGGVKDRLIEAGYDVEGP